jgi:phage terminase large subunit-like protein
MTNPKPGAPGSSRLSQRKHARDIVKFFAGALRHSKGPYAGQPFRLTRWQRQDIVEPLFGTRQGDGRRQYRTAFVEMPRKNGKSELAAGIALVMLFLDNEPGAEVLCLAADVDQARVVFGECQRLVEGSPEIRQAFRPIVYRDSIEYRETDSVLRVLSADEKGIHGRNPSALVIDELHTFTTRKQREFFAGATTAMGARGNPLALLISSAGWDKASVCYELHGYAADVRAGLRTDPTFLSVFYGAGEGADWRDRDVWRAANPALTGPDAFLSMEYLESEFRQAEAMPARQNAFRTFYLNQWVGQANRFLDLQAWDASAGHTTSLDDLRGREGFGGLDLGAISDFTAAALLARCEQDPEAWDVHLRCYLPEASLIGHRHEERYRQFHRDGWLTLTPGNVADYRFVERDFIGWSSQLTLRAVNIDSRFQGIQTATMLSEAGIDCRQMPQTHAGFAAPMKELERLVKAGKLHHGSNPMLRMAIDHLVVDIDSNGDAKPAKTRAHEKIDPIVAVLMALELAIRHVAAPEPQFQIFMFGGRR